MFANERQDKIFEMIKNSGGVTTARLVDYFSVSIETIRRDLLTMEQNGRLRRVHGGAVAKNDMKTYSELKVRNKEFIKEKSLLSQKASEFISEGDIIGVDAGSTAISFAQALKERFSRLTVVTHSLDVFEMLCDYKDFTVILCSGNYLRDERAFYGEFALNMLSSLHIQKAFIFPSAISLEYGLFDYQKDMYQVQKQMIKSASEIFILADSSKFEKTGFLKINNMSSDYVYITDSNLQNEIVMLYKENNIRICLGGRKG